MTEAEKLLWSRIRRKQLDGFQFYRQKILGNYIVDFFVQGRNSSSSWMEVSIIRNKDGRRIKQETNTSQGLD